MRYDIILLWLNTDKRMRTFSIMSDFDKVFEQVWNVNLFSNSSADVMKVLEQTEEIMNEQENCTGDYETFDQTYFVMILALIGLILGILWSASRILFFRPQTSQKPTTGIESVKPKPATSSKEQSSRKSPKESPQMIDTETLPVQRPRTPAPSSLIERVREQESQGIQLSPEQEEPISASPRRNPMRKVRSSPNI